MMFLGDEKELIGVEQGTAELFQPLVLNEVNAQRQLVFGDWPAVAKVKRPYRLSQRIGSTGIMQTLGHQIRLSHGEFAVEQIQSLKGCC